MSTLRKGLLIAVFAGTSASTTVAAGIVTSHLATDQEMLSQLTAIAFVAEGRIGDLGGAATFEMDIGDDTGNPFSTQNYGWGNGVVEPFSLSYDKPTNTATFTLGGHSLQYQPGLSFAEMFIRARATTNASVSVDNLLLNGDAVGDQSSAAGAGGLDILAISGVKLDDGFTLTGAATLTWTGAAPHNSALAFQIKVGNAPAVPTDHRTWGNIKALYE